MSPKGYRYYRREFLNRPGTYAGAYVLATVTDNGYPDLVIADCDRVVRFEFDVGGRRRHRNALHKLDVLIDALTGLRAALVEAEAENRRR